MIRQRFLCILILAILLPTCLLAQTFNDRRVINSHSVELLQPRKFDLRIAHRFGDMFGNSGGYQTFWGLDNAADILIGFDYGVSRHLNIGLSRTKGAGPINKFLNGTLKYRLLDQHSPKAPVISLVALGVLSVSTMEESTNPEALSNFKEFSHRLVYTGQLLAARQFSEIFSAQLIASLTHRNQVVEEDNNDLFTIGFASRLKVNRTFALLLDLNVPFSDFRSSDNGFYPGLGFGLEIETGGGHVFQINFTNARALIENDFIPYTRSSWGDGEFRLGFTISRTFNL